MSESNESNEYLPEVQENKKLSARQRRRLKDCFPTYRTLPARSPKSLTNYLKVLKALEMKRQGYSYAQIADILELNKETIINRIDDTLKQFCFTEVEKFRFNQAMEIQSLKENIMIQLQERPNSSSLMNTYIQLLKREADLLGLDKRFASNNENQRIPNIRKANICIITDSNGFEKEKILPKPQELLDGITSETIDVTYSEELDEINNRINNTIPWRTLKKELKKTSNGKPLIHPERKKRMEEKKRQKEIDELLNTSDN